MSRALGMRGDRRRVVIAAAVIAVLLAAATVVLWPRGGATDAETTASVHHTTSPQTAPTVAAAASEGLAVDMTEAVAVVPPEGESAGDAAQSSLASAAAAAPQEREGTAGLGQERAPIDPADVVDPDAALGGCHPAYGETGQCLPVIPPSLAAHVAEMEEAGLDASAMAHTWTCAEVALSFPDGIAVRVPGTDPDGLDADGDGVACEPDD